MLGPLLVTVTAKATVSPSAGAGLPEAKVLTVTRSASGAVVVTVSERSFPALVGSDRLLTAAVVVLVITVPAGTALTVPSRVRVAEAPEASSGIVQVDPA